MYKIGIFERIKLSCGYLKRYKDIQSNDPRYF